MHAKARSRKELIKEIVVVHSIFGSKWQRMEQSNHLLSFVTNIDGGVVTIHTDLNGISLLIGRLVLIRDQLVKGECPHTHLHSKEAVGDELSTTKLADQPNESSIVHQVKIYGWNDEWAVIHGLR